MGTNAIVGGMQPANQKLHLNGLTLHPLRLPFQLAIASGITVNRFVYAFLIESPHGATLIDTGTAGSFALLRDKAASLAGGLSALTQIILTHAHPDHIGGAASLLKICSAKVLAHPAEIGWIEDVAVQKKARPVPGFDTLVAGSVPVDRSISDDERIEGGVPLRVLHTPGHSDGSISLYIESAGVLFCGDAVPLPNAMPIYTDVDVSMQSLLRLKSLPNLQCLYSSWDDPKFGPDARQAIDAGIATLKKIHETVKAVDRERNTPSISALCTACVEKLGLPPFADNPLTAVSFAAHRTAALPLMG